MQRRGKQTEERKVGQGAEERKADREEEKVGQQNRAVGEGKWDK